MLIVCIIKLKTDDTGVFTLLVYLRLSMCHLLTVDVLSNIQQIKMLKTGGNFKIINTFPCHFSFISLVNWKLFDRETGLFCILCI